MFKWAFKKGQLKSSLLNYYYNSVNLRASLQACCAQITKKIYWGDFLQINKTDIKGLDNGTYVSATIKKPEFVLLSWAFRNKWLMKHRAGIKNYIQPSL